MDYDILISIFLLIFFICFIILIVMLYNDINIEILDFQ